MNYTFDYNSNDQDIVKYNKPIFGIFYLNDKDFQNTDESLQLFCSIGMQPAHEGKSFH